MGKIRRIIIPIAYEKENEQKAKQPLYKVKFFGVTLFDLPDPTFRTYKITSDEFPSTQDDPPIIEGGGYGTSYGESYGAK